MLAIALCGGCLAASAATSNGSSRPGVMPMLSELPGDPVKRDAVLDSAAATPGPEHHRQQLPGKQRKAETAAATAAAIIGGMFSKTQNVTIGTVSTFDENAILAPLPQQPPKKRSEPASDGEAAGEAPEDAPLTEDGAPLVPWIKLN